MVTFDQSLLRLYQEGLISYEEALRHADSANEVRLAVKLSEGGDAESLSGKLQDMNLIDDSR
jgi:twitching motility protein PilU